MIKLNKRETGKSVDFYKNQGFVPGVLYGPKTENTLICAEFNEIDNAFKKSEGQLASFQFEDKTLEGILQDSQIDPIANKIIHFDIYVPALDKPVTTSVPLVFLNTEELEKQGFIINKNLDEIEIEALPKDIPENIEVDLGILEHAHQSLFVKDLKTLSNVTITIPPETPVVSILSAEDTEK